MIRVNEQVVKTERYRDGTLKLSLDSWYSYINPNSHQIFIEWSYENDSELFELYTLKRELDNFYGFGTRFILLLPYLPNARQDRRGSHAFTLKYFAEIINMMKFSNVILFEPHSDVGPALIENSVIWKVDSWESKLKELKESVDAVMYPDSGAAKRYDATDDDFIGFKHRNSEDKIDRFELLNFKEGIKSVLIIDDICSSGMTFCAAAKALKERGVEKVYLAVAHCENELMSEEVFKYVDKIYTTNSICRLKDERIKIFPID